MSSRFEQKHQTIVEAAIKVFLEHGYGGTSMDKIAEVADLSKVTVYNHFKDKKDLFKKVMQAHCENLAQNAPKISLNTQASLEQNLTRLAENIVSALLAPRSVALMRVVIFETGQIPELGSLIWHEGKLPLLDEFRSYLELENQQGRLQIDNTQIAARQFFGMIKENLVWPVLMGLKMNDSAKFRKDVIQSSVKMFLAFSPSKYSV